MVITECLIAMSFTRLYITYSIRSDYFDSCLILMLAPQGIPNQALHSSVPMYAPGSRDTPSTKRESSTVMWKQLRVILFRFQFGFLCTNTVQTRHHIIILQKRMNLGFLKIILTIPKQYKLLQALNDTYSTKVCFTLLYFCLAYK